MLIYSPWNAAEAAPLNLIYKHFNLRLGIALKHSTFALSLFSYFHPYHYFLFVFMSVLFFLREAPTWCMWFPSFKALWAAVPVGKVLHKWSLMVVLLLFGHQRAPSDQKVPGTTKPQELNSSLRPFCWYFQHICSAVKTWSMILLHLLRHHHSPSEPAMISLLTRTMKDSVQSSD